MEKVLSALFFIALRPFSHSLFKLLIVIKSVVDVSGILI